MLLPAKAPTRMKMLELTKETILPTNPTMEIKKRAAQLTARIREETVVGGCADVSQSRGLCKS